MKLIDSGVQREAAPTKSASFSREGSSATITRRPAAISAMISLMGLKSRWDSDIGRIGKRCGERPGLSSGTDPPELRPTDDGRERAGAEDPSTGSGHGRDLANRARDVSRS